MAKLKKNPALMMRVFITFHKGSAVVGCQRTLGKPPSLMQVSDGKGTTIQRCSATIYLYTNNFWLTVWQFASCGLRVVIYGFRFWVGEKSDLG
jgi:hypothetical protein